MHTVSANNYGNPAKQMLNPLETTVAPTVTAKLPAQVDEAEHKYSVWFWAALFAVFVGWGYYQHNGTIKKELEPKNIAANWHNLVVITFAAVIGIVGGKILFVKLADVTKNIPFVSTATSYIAQLFTAS